MGNDYALLGYINDDDSHMNVEVLKFFDKLPTKEEVRAAVDECVANNDTFRSEWENGETPVVATRVVMMITIQEYALKFSSSRM